MPATVTLQSLQPELKRPRTEVCSRLLWAASVESLGQAQLPAVFRSVVVLFSTKLMISKGQIPRWIMTSAVLNT